jgi:hypothetical protein
MDAIRDSLLHSEFDGFLFASIGAERNNAMPISVVSALARLELDPWTEAGELARLPRDVATKRLTALLVRLPSGLGLPQDSAALADHLIMLLPSRTTVLTAPAALPPKTKLIIGAMIIVALLQVGLLILDYSHRGTPAPTTDVKPVVGSESPKP